MGTCAVSTHVRKGNRVRAHVRKKAFVTKFSKAKKFTEKQRTKLAKKGAALPDGSFPINSKRDLANAIRSKYRSTKPLATIEAHIRKRAKALKVKLT